MSNVAAWFAAVLRGRAKTKELVIRFKSFIGDYSISTPVVAAKKVRVDWMKKQKHTDHRFSRCPGMLDYAHAGFLILAHTDIHIKANTGGVVINYGFTPTMPEHDVNLLRPQPFEYQMVADMAPFQEGVKRNAWKIPLPWTVQADKGMSAYLMPALMHMGEFTDKMWIYPGVVDYDTYHTCNLVFSVIKPCEFTIPAGTPLLQVLPFKRFPIVGECGKATPHERDRQLQNFPTRARGAFWKYFHADKPVTMRGPECPFHKETEK